MSGTWLQQESYGAVSNSQLVLSAPSTDEILTQIRNIPAVAQARASSCPWIVVTAMYQPTAGALKPPLDANGVQISGSEAACWLAFVDRSEHSTPGWTQVPVLVAQSYERNSNAFKVMLPALFGRPVAYVDKMITSARCLSLDHLTRGAELTRHEGRVQPHLFASGMPWWSARGSIEVQLNLTRGFLEKRSAMADLAQLEDFVDKLKSSRFEMKQAPRVTDTIWMFWPGLGDGVEERLSRLWLDEILSHSAFEKVSYSWVAAQVPAFRTKLVDAVYIYSREQRCSLEPSKGTWARVEEKKVETKAARAKEGDKKKHEDKKPPGRKLHSKRHTQR